MKSIYMFLFILLCLNIKGQIIEKDSLILNEIKEIPLYELDTCISQLLKKLVDNCRADTSLNKYNYGYLFYSKNKDSCFCITIKPIETSKFYDVNFYGAFEVYGRMFYCIGDKPDILLKKTVQDFIEIRPTDKPKNDSIAIALVMDRFSDLNTIQVVKNITLNNQSYSFFIQPCNILNKKVLRRFKYKPNCKCVYC